MKLPWPILVKFRLGEQHFFSVLKIVGREPNDRECSEGDIVGHIHEDVIDQGTREP